MDKVEQCTYTGRNTCHITAAFSDIRTIISKVT